MTGWIALLGSLIGGLLALTGVLLAQMWAMRRDREARLWTRQADAYVALMRWRLSPPDEVAIANPHDFAQAEQKWKEDAYPLLAELSLFGGPDLQTIFKQNPYLFQAVDQLAKVRPGELAEVVHADITAGMRRSKIKKGIRNFYLLWPDPDDEGNVVSIKRQCCIPDGEQPPNVGLGDLFDTHLLHIQSTSAGLAEMAGPSWLRKP